MNRFGELAELAQLVVHKCKKSSRDNKNKGILSSYEVPVHPVHPVRYSCIVLGFKSLRLTMGCRFFNSIALVGPCPQAFLGSIFSNSSRVA